MRRLISKKFNKKDQMEIESLYKKYEWYITRLALYISKICSSPVEDLKQEGFLGLARAHELYNPKIASFLTYAQHWIRMAMFSYAYRSGYVASIPEDFHAMYSKYKKKSAELGDGATITQIAESMGTTVSRIKKMLRTVKALKSRTDIDDIDKFGLAKDSAAAISEDTELKAESSDSKLLVIAKKVVTPEEYFVLNHTLGLEVDNPKTLSWVGIILGVTKERVRQIKNAALDKIREKLQDGSNI